MTAPSDTGVIDALAQYHPLIIEGMGGYDPREPAPVAMQIVSQLHDRWRERPLTKPVILVTQGDPIEERGISAITRLVADELAIPRALVTLPAAIDPEHAPNAPREGVVLEVGYDALAASLEDLAALETAIDAALAAKNRARERPLAPYYRDYALLQEVTKGALHTMCGSLTLAHTDSAIPGDSVTSFYEVGLGLGLYSRGDVVPYV